MANKRLAAVGRSVLRKDGFDKVTGKLKTLVPEFPSVRLTPLIETKGLESLSLIVTVAVAGEVNLAPPLGLLSARLKVSLPFS